MKLTRPRVLFLLMILAYLLGLAIYSRLIENYQKPNMISLSSRMQPIFEKTKTVCFGRFVFDVPSTATVIYGTAWAPTDIVRYPGAARELNGRVDQLVTKLKSELEMKFAHDIAKEPLYGTVTDGVVPGQKLVFGQDLGIYIRADSFVPLGSDLYRQWSRGKPERDRGNKNGSQIITDEVGILNDVARHLRARSDDEVPVEPGLCIDGAFISDTPAVTHEQFPVGIRLKEFPDVSFSILTNKNQGSLNAQDALELRLERAKKQAWALGAGLWYTSIHTLRRGERSIGKWKGFENLAFLPRREDAGESHDFAFMALGSPTDPDLPLLDVRMSAGVEDNSSGKTAPSLTDEEAVAVWDKLIGSIRVRPTSSLPAKTSDAVNHQPPLGEFAATGRSCPQTGWWQCEQEGDVQGGRRQFFREGDRMPHVVVRSEPKLWQKLKGETPMRSVATMWELVEHGAYRALPEADRPSAAPLPRKTDES